MLIRKTLSKNLRFQKETKSSSKKKKKEKNEATSKVTRIKEKQTIFYFRIDSCSTNILTPCTARRAKKKKRKKKTARKKRIEDR